MAAPIKIGELLLSQGVLTQKQLQIALEQQQVTGAILGDLLIKLGFITAPEFARTIAVQSGLEYLELSEFEPEEEALRLIPKEIAEKIGVIPNGWSPCYRHHQPKQHRCSGYSNQGHR